MKKRIGIGLLVAGFFLLLIDAASTFSSYQHTQWIWHSQNLPAGDTIPREAAISAMRDLSLALKNRHRIVLIPGLFMLTGGLMVFFARPANRRITDAEQGVHGNTH